jgi:hypothetical protein
VCNLEKKRLLSDALGAAVPGEAVLPQRKMWGVKYMHKPVEQVLIASLEDHFQYIVSKGWM